MNQLDANDYVNGLLDEVARQAKEIAILKIHLAAAQRPAPEEEVTEDDSE